jgi:hypothetical protein
VVEEPDDRGGPVPLTTLSAATLWDSPGDLAAIAVHPAPPGDTGAVLRRLGTPPGCRPADVATLDELVAAAARLAWRLVAANGDGGGDDVPEHPLLDELRARGSATSRELADALGIPPADVRAGLAPLLELGVVHRTGHARSTRYHA